MLAVLRRRTFEPRHGARPARRQIRLRRYAVQTPQNRMQTAHADVRHPVPAAPVSARPAHPSRHKEALKHARTGTKLAQKLIQKLVPLCSDYRQLVTGEADSAILKKLRYPRRDPLE